MVCYFMQFSIASRVQVPYGYSPVLAVNADTLETTGPLVSKFLEASSKGWQDFVNDPEACAAQVCSSSALNLYYFNWLFPGACDESSLLHVEGMLRMCAVAPTPRLPKLR